MSSQNRMHQRCTSYLRCVTEPPLRFAPFGPNTPLAACWSVPDPAAVEGTLEQIERAFFEAFTILNRRITLFLCLPLATLERDVIQSEIDRIGRQ